MRTAIKGKRWPQARYGLSRARAIVSALPFDQAVEERAQLAELRKWFDARNTPAAQKARDAKRQKPAPAKRASGRKAVTKPTAKAVSQKPKLAPVHDLGDRRLDRAALGYAPTDGW
ncbi:hypothetical protein ACFYYI_18055 [Streptomyces sp. NPDC002387]|uniref:hypothetical protein n=1 Tax=Streptomyces sp. NPDC002387 TaxID=3364643 RepID=UPI003693DAEE